MDARPVSPRAAAALALALRPLAELREWDRVAALAERVVAAMAGAEGLDPRDAADVRSLSAAWSALPDDVRSFYVGLLGKRGVEAAAARVALSHLLDGRPTRLENWTTGALRRAWLDLHGVSPELCAVNLWR